ncbi:MFS general substrate transporter [Cylindrobasidium torrendii FP15055 ss-10]|uniref:MFS general substrate transporter n=1 Tax=Cylindrobasidium torrendii FP15055 ss-10 TaxID=1314674 RepID=A0A0D7BV55_9AGAR|nr:MFS general substrate transporter [Cylindrobasidium torrendii FP15055 ss-10]
MSRPSSEICAAADTKDDDLKDDQVAIKPVQDGDSRETVQPAQEFRLYKRRFVGVIGMVILNIVSAMCWPWFGPISNNVAAEFDITLDEVTWLGNIVACIYLPSALLIPWFISRYGIRRACDVGAFFLIISSWVRYAGTVESLPRRGAYALLMFGQMFAAIAQPIFQCLGAKYSETWFDLRGRTTATMVMSISNPIGGAIGQLLSPLITPTRQSILVLGIICTAATPAVFLVGNAPPTPPTYAATHKSRSMLALLRRLLGIDQSEGDDFIRPRERIDFGLLWICFATLSGTTTAFSVLTNQIMEPYGYSSDTAGLLGATLLLAGIVAAVITAPLFDLVLTRHLTYSAKIAIPSIAVCWLAMIWAVKRDNEAGLFVLMAVTGVFSIAMMPVGLELACELTRNADGSSSLLWFGTNLFCIIFVLSEGALRADASADPPYNMHRALIFNGSFLMSTSGLIFFLKGKLARKEQDIAKIQEAREMNAPEVEP